MLDIPPKSLPLRSWRQSFLPPCEHPRAVIQGEHGWPATTGPSTTSGLPPTFGRHCCHGSYRDQNPAFLVSPADYDGEPVLVPAVSFQASSYADIPTFRPDFMAQVPEVVIPAYPPITCIDIRPLLLLSRVCSRPRTTFSSGRGHESLLARAIVVTGGSKVLSHSHVSSAGR